MFDCTIQQHSIPTALIGPLHEFRGPLDATAIERDLDQQGYALLRNALDKQRVLAAREEVFCRLEAVGEIHPPAINGIATGASQRQYIERDPGGFWKSVSEGELLRSVSHGSRLCEIMDAVLGESSRPHDLVYLRPTPAGRSTRLHYDYPFFAGRSNRILTAWMPLGDVALDEGPLTVVEGSNRFSDLIEPIRGVDYQQDRSNEVVQKAAYEKQNETDPVTLVRSRESRFLTTQFAAGDLMIFQGFTMHGSLDNRSPLGRVRLSLDVRYQPAADPADDERYFGKNPIGSKGGGYGDMRGAKPLNEPW